jgi:hypothetical protein
MRQGKTHYMKHLEVLDPGKRSIQQILQDAYLQGGTQAAAAEIVGISASLYGHWVMRLGVQLPKPRKSA